MNEDECTETSKAERDELITVVREEYEALIAVARDFVVLSNAVHVERMTSWQMGQRINKPHKSYQITAAERLLARLDKS